MIVYALTYGDGSDGDEWGLVSLHATKESWAKAKEKYEQPRPCTNGETWRTYANDIEEWEVEP